MWKDEFQTTVLDKSKNTKRGLSLYIHEYAPCIPYYQKFNSEHLRSKLLPLLSNFIFAKAYTVLQLHIRTYISENFPVTTI